MSGKHSGTPAPPEPPSALDGDVMAFAKTMGIDIQPSQAVMIRALAKQRERELERARALPEWLTNADHDAVTAPLPRALEYFADTFEEAKQIKIHMESGCIYDCLIRQEAPDRFVVIATPLSKDEQSERWGRRKKAAQELRNAGQRLSMQNALVQEDPREQMSAELADKFAEAKFVMTRLLSNLGMTPQDASAIDDWKTVANTEQFRKAMEGFAVATGQVADQMASAVRGVSAAIANATIQYSVPKVIF